MTMIEVHDATLEIFARDARPGATAVAAAHPASVFGAATAELVADLSQRDVVCINGRGIGGSSPGQVSLEQMVDDIEAVRQSLGRAPWVFFGMSGGGWLAQLYAHRHPSGLAGIVVESVCACFRERLADPSCALSPFFPAWRDALRARDLVVEGSHANPSSADDDETEWCDVEGVGQVLRRRGGPALLVSPMPIDADMKRAMSVLWTFDSRAWLAKLRTPALVIAGGADPVVPVARVRAVHAAIPGSTFVVIEGGGHVPSAARAPEAVSALRTFVAACGAS